MKFRKIKLIRDIMEDMLAPYGFSIRSEGSKEVAFSRKRNTVVQYILVNIALPSSLRIFLNLIHINILQQVAMSCYVK